MYVEAARAATLAVHSAASLSWAASPSAARLLRVAEGLVRAATSVLQTAGTSKKSGCDEAGAKDVQPPGGNKSGGGATPGTCTGTSRSARRRRRRRFAKEARSRAGEVAGGGKSGTKETNIARSGDRMASVDGYMEGGEVFDTYAAHSEAAPVAASPASRSEVKEVEEVEVAAAPVSVDQARAAVALLSTDSVRALAQSLGGSGQGRRKALVEFCVARRLGGPQRAV